MKQNDKWTIGSETFVAGTVEASLTGNVTGSASLNLLISNNLSDLANAATARTNLGVDAAGTDNSTDVTLAGTLDYITISGQQITRNAINLTTDVTGTLPVANGGTGLTSISTLLNSNVTPSSLGLVIGTNVQAQDTLLQDIADFSLSNPSQDGYLIAYSDAEPQLELVAPGISFNGSTANGLLTYGNSTTADVETDLVYTATGLGIGTTSPASKLHIRNNSAADQLRLGRVDDDSYLSVGAGANNAVYNMVTGGTIAHQFQEDGDAKMTILTNGNVGIGTSSPTYELDVAGDIGVDHVIYHNGDTNTYHQFTTDRQRFFAGGELLLDLYEDGTQDYVKLGDGGDVDINLNDDMFVEGSSGNVLIGRTSAFSSARVEIQNDATEQLTLNNVSTDGKMLSLYNSGTIVGGLGNDVAELVIYQGTTEAIRIDSSQNVGIGDTNPPNKLSVKGSSTDLLYLEGDGITSNSIIQSATGGSTRIRSAGGKLEVYTGGSANSSSASGATFAMVVDASQRVGIGTSSPAVDLHILDTGGHSQLRIETDSASHGAYLELESTTNKYQIYNVGGDLGIDESGVATRLTIKDSTGNVGIGVASPQSILHVGTGNTSRHIKVSDSRAMFGYNGSNAVVQGGNTKGIQFHTNTDTFSGSAK